MNTQIIEIKERLPITEVLADYIQLRKAGVNFKAACPFHNEKTPSLIVSPAKQIWHCFGCGLGGDIFKFVELAENVEFRDALKILADRAGVELRKPTELEIKQEKKRADLYEINDAAAKYYTRVLWKSESSKQALEYLRKRGLTDRTIQNWRLGFAPDDFHYLENFLAKSFDKKDIEQAGLIIKSDKGEGTRGKEEYFDRFRGRIMFPILNIHGQVVGFTGRLLVEKENAGKYINSPETPIYNKSKIIYGLYQAKATIRKLDQAIIVEGQADVIASHQAGFTQTVASSGTAFTEQQLVEIKKLTNNLIFSFDSDKAGVLAAERTLNLALKLGFDIRIVKIHNAKDPDEVIRRGGPKAWEKIINTAPRYADFMLEALLSQYDSTSPTGISEIAEKMVQLIAYFSSPFLAAHYIRNVSEALNIPEKIIYDKLREIKLPAPKEAPTGALVRKDRKNIVEDLYLGLVFLLDQKLEDLDQSYFAPENATLVACIQSKQQLDADQSERAEYLKFAADSYLQEQNLDGNQELLRLGNEYRKIVYREQMDMVTQKLNLAQKSGQKDEVQKLSKIASELTIKIAKLR